MTRIGRPGREDLGNGQESGNLQELGKSRHSSRRSRKVGRRRGNSGNHRSRQELRVFRSDRSFSSQKGRIWVLDREMAGLAGSWDLG